MSKKRVPDFIYIKSDALKQEVAFSKKTGWVYCEDKHDNGKLVSYSPAELAIMEKAGVQIDMVTHNVKKIFCGEVVQIEQPTDKGKPNEGTGGNDKPNNPDTDDKIPPHAGACPQDGNGELDIF